MKRFTFVVGSSGSGKTAFLEALFLTGGSSAEIYFRVRRWRGLGESAIELTGFRDSFESLFRDMFHNFDQAVGLEIKFTDTERGWRSLEVAFGKKGTYELPLKGGRPENMFLTSPINFKWETPEKVINSAVEIKDGQLKFEGTPDVFPLVFVSPKIASAKHDALRYSDLSRQNKAAPVLAAVRKIFPEVRAITLESVAGELVLHADIEGMKEKLPLVDLSAGIN